MTTSARDSLLAVCRLLAQHDGNEPLPPEQPLLAFSDAHRLTTLVSSALRTRNTADGDYRALHDAAAKAAFHQIKNDALTASILTQLYEKGVVPLPLKGAAIAAVYPDGWIRTATDTDWFIPDGQLPTAVKLLEELGFTKTADHDGEMSFQKPPRCVIELHTTLGGYSKKQQQTLRALSQTPFTINEHYVYTLFHLYKHFLYAGAGVRMFLDMYYLSRAVTDRACVEAWLTALDLLPFEDAVRRVSAVLFEGAVCTDELCEVVDLVLTSGTFGVGSTYHALKNAARPITHKNRFLAWTQDYGFDRQAMTARYPVLARHIWVYPVCVIHRVLHGIIFKRTVLQAAVKEEHAADRKQIDRILKTMNIL